MPPKVESCVDAILEDPDQPDDESRAWAICRAQHESGVEDPEVHALLDTNLIAEGLDELAERRPDEWTRAESEYGVAWIGQQSGQTIYLETQAYEYPDAAPEDAPPEVQEAVERFREDPDPDTPLLYRVLGTGTEPYKMAKADADYQEEPEGDEACANCEYAYEGMDGRFICSQVAGEIAPDAWCRLWDGLETSESQLAQQAVGEDGWSSDLRVFRVLADPESDMEYKDEVLGVGVDFPEAGTYVDWHREAFPDELDEPHVSEYGSIEDLEKATGNIIEEPHPAGGSTPDQQAVTVDGIELGFPPGGEVIDHEEGDWEAFLDDLAELGDVFQTYGGGGLRVHPDDPLESHDAPTFVALTDGDVTDVEAVLADHPAVEYTINAGSVGAMDQPDDWDPEASEFYHGTGAVEQESMRVFGLSQEAREAMEERYNVTVVPGG